MGNNKITGKNLEGIFYHPIGQEDDDFDILVDKSKKKWYFLWLK